MKKTGLDNLNDHLFEAIEMLKNNNDPGASDNEKMDIETAKTIADIGKVVVEGFKVKAQVMNMLRNTDNPKAMKSASIQGGFFSDNDIKLLDDNKKDE